MAEPWTRMVQTTINKHIRDVEVNILRERKLLALAEQKGRITFGHSGKKFDWRVKYKRAPLVGYEDTDTVSFARINRHQTAELPWRGYSAAEQVTKMEMLMNRGEEAIVKFVTEMTTDQMNDVRENFHGELYVDGNASGNSARIHGVESFLGDTGTGASTGYVGVASDTYAGLVTTLGNYGGTWSGSWPDGSGDSHYDFFTPLHVDYTDTLWTPTTKTWPNTCVEALRYGIIKGKRNKMASGGLDMIILTNEMFRNFKDAYEPAQRIDTRSARMMKLGFDDVMNFDGVDVGFEYGTTSAVGYGWSLDNLEILSMQDTLFKSSGWDENVESKSRRISVDFFGNMKFNPRCFVKWKAIT